MNRIELLPAIDVTGGRAVRLSSGVVDDRSWADPAQVARSFEEAGARWVHLVDLDRAFGRGNDDELLARVMNEVDVAIQLSGGIVSRGDVEAALEAGPDRVNIATQALDDLDAVRDAIDIRPARLGLSRCARRASRGAGHLA